MTVAIITGAAGLIGSEAALHSSKGVAFMCPDALTIVSRPSTTSVTPML